MFRIGQKQLWVGDAMLACCNEFAGDVFQTAVKVSQKSNKRTIWATS